MASRAQNIYFPLAGSGERMPLVFVHPIGGGVLCYLQLARGLAEDRPFCAIQSPFLDGETPVSVSMASLAERYIEVLLSMVPEGPLLLGGWSMGGAISFEMATQLVERGRTVRFLALIDTPPASIFNARVESGLDRMVRFARHLSSRSVPPPLLAERLEQCDSEEAQLVCVRDVLLESRSLKGRLDVSHLKWLYHVMSTHHDALCAWAPRPYAGDVWFWEAKERTNPPFFGPGWESLVSGTLRMARVPGDHFSLMSNSNVGSLISCILDAMREVSLQS